MGKSKNLQKRWDEEVLTDNSQFENCKQCKDCKFQSDGTIWSNHYTKASCQKYPYPKYKPVEIIDNEIECCYRQLQSNTNQTMCCSNGNEPCEIEDSIIMEAFSEKSLLALGDFYVYGLIDPRTDKIFYIGKGTGNRVFEHEKESLSNPNSNKLKLKIISEIKAMGKGVTKIIIRDKLTEKEAFAIEASLINVLNYISNNKLTNIVSGHHSSEILTVEEYEKKYGAVELAKEDIKHKVVFIKINKLYKRDITADELYDVVRGVWRATLEKAQYAEYVLGVYNSLIVAVYKPTKWYKCKHASDRLPKHIEGLNEKLSERIFFVDEDFESGKLWDENQYFYYGKSVAKYERIQKSVNPFVYGELFR